MSIANKLSQFVNYLNASGKLTAGGIDGTLSNNTTGNAAVALLANAVVDRSIITSSFAKGALANLATLSDRALNQVIFTPDAVGSVDCFTSLDTTPIPINGQPDIQYLRYLDGTELPIGSVWQSIAMSTITPSTGFVFALKRIS